MSTTPETEASRQTEKPAPVLRHPRVRVGALVAVAALVGVVVWLLVSSRGSTSKKGVQTTVVAVSPGGLRTLAKAVGQPIYWLGTQANMTYELSRTSNGRVYIRYLPAGVKVGDRRPFLTVGTYSVRNAYGIVDTGSRQPGSVRITVTGGGVGVYRPSGPTNVYVAYPGSDSQIEVYDPTPGLARRLVERGQLVAVGGNQRGAPAIAVSAGRLKALVASLGQPVYWVGSEPKVTYELTRAPGGRIFVRYLPRGVPVGAPKPYLTVGTYPVRKAFAVTKSAAAQPGAVTIPVGGGGIAVYNAQHPTNIYLAYPGVDFQIELYDPKPSEARKLVAAESIEPVR